VNGTGTTTYSHPSAKPAIVNIADSNMKLVVLVYVAVTAVERNACKLYDRLFYSA